MQNVWKGKASAGDQTPGFFYFVICLVAGTMLIVHLGYSQDRRPIRSLTVAGNSLVSSTVVAAWLESHSGGPFVESDAQAITARYAAAGFPFARVDSIVFRSSVDTSATDVLVWISEGKPAHFASIRINGIHTVDNAAAFAPFGVDVGRPFAPSALEHDLGALLSLYEQSGYPFTKIAVSEISFQQEGDSLGAHVVLEVNEGLFARISHVRVEGNTTTKTGLIVREARIADGEIFRGTQAEKVKERLQRLQLFSSVALPELYVENDSTVGMTVKVTEGSPNRFDGVVGYAPASGSAGGYVSGLIDVQFRNIFGTGRRFAARWYRETQSSQEISLQYLEPWIASLPVNAEIGFTQRKQDSTYIRGGYRITADLMATEEFDLGVVLSSEQVTPTEGFGRSVISESRSLDIGALVSYDSRNDPVTPTSGFRYRTEYSTGYKEIVSTVLPGRSNRSATQKVLFDFQFVATTLARQVVAVNLSARDFRSSAVELSDLFRLGGATSLRGYREGQFLGSRIAWINLEYRFLAGQRSFFFGFVDAGYVGLTDRPEVGLVGQEITRFGYGTGLRVDTPLGLIGVSLAFGKGDTFGTAKLHIQLANEF